MHACLYVCIYLYMCVYVWLVCFGSVVVYICDTVTEKTRICRTAKGPGQPHAFVNIIFDAIFEPSLFPLRGP